MRVGITNGKSSVITQTRRVPVPGGPDSSFSPVFGDCIEFVVSEAHGPILTLEVVQAGKSRLPYLFPTESQTMLGATALPLPNFKQGVRVWRLFGSDFEMFSQSALLVRTLLREVNVDHGMRLSAMKNVQHKFVRGCKCIPAESDTKTWVRRWKDEKHAVKSCGGTFWDVTPDPNRNTVTCDSPQVESRHSSLSMHSMQSFGYDEYAQEEVLVGVDDEDIEELLARFQAASNDDIFII